MTEAEIDIIAERWIRSFSAPAENKAPDLEDDDSWWDIPREQPDLCFSVILCILRRISTEEPNHLLSLVAAGPMEDLLVAHGDTLIERIETEARVNPALKLLLGGVWQNAMSDDVWSRVQAAREKAW